MKNNPKLDPLPYHDRKPHGYGEFYRALNATFRYIDGKKGRSHLEKFWEDHGKNYMAPIWKKWKAGGLDAIALYWRAFFAHEPGAEVKVTANQEFVDIRVSVCPAIKHLKETDWEIFPHYCQHCYFVSEAAAQQSGYTIRVDGGNGTCSQRFYPAQSAPEKQNLSDIRLAQ